jgi:hypothetical protein
MEKESINKILEKSKELLPHSLREAFFKSVKQAFSVSLQLIKIYIPLSLLTIFLKQTGFFNFISPFFAPVMRLMGLPGETAITLIAGLTNMYGAIATMAVFDLTFRQITILGVVVGLAHNLIIETVILIKLRMSDFRIVFFRIFTAILTGILMNLLLPKNISGKLLNPYYKVQEFSWTGVARGMGVTCVQIVCVIFIVMLCYELLLLWKYTPVLKQKVAYIAKIIGFSENAFGPWIVGFFAGIMYGAGIMFQLQKNHKLSHKDTCLTTIFLSLTHAIIEDTMLFVIIGGNFWWIIGIRVSMAFIVTRILSINDLYKKFSWIGLAKEH